MEFQSRACEGTWDEPALVSILERAAVITELVEHDRLHNAAKTNKRIGSAVTTLQVLHTWIVGLVSSVSVIVARAFSADLPVALPTCLALSQTGGETPTKQPGCHCVQRLQLATCNCR